MWSEVRMPWHGRAEGLVDNGRIHRIMCHVFRPPATFFSAELISLQMKSLPRKNDFSSLRRLLLSLPVHRSVTHVFPIFLWLLVAKNHRSSKCERKTCGVCMWPAGLLEPKTLGTILSCSIKKGLNMI